MLKRPKPGEDEEDILRMQKEFLQEKKKDVTLQPSAQVVNLRTNYKETITKYESKKLSKYAQAKNLKGQKSVRFDEPTCVGDIVEKNIEESFQKVDEDDKVYYPKVLPTVLSNIIEKNVGNALNISQINMPITGFPTVATHDKNLKSGKKTIYMRNLEKQKELKIDMDESSMTVDINPVNNELHSSTLSIQSKSLNIPNRSFIVTSKDADAIHKENIEVLNKMSEQEILQERNKLLHSLDPALIEFIKSKRNKETKTKYSENLETNTHEKMDILENTNGTIDTDTLWENDIFSHSNVVNWLHFDILEKDKVEWMKGIEETKEIRPEEPYEARFNFRGYLLPYSIEYTEKTKTLFHHGEEAHRPGYSFSELFELARSTVTQQRVMALNTIGGVLEYYMSGIYKDVIVIPLSKIFFVIRFALDENTTVILEPSLRAMRNLLCSRIDESCLDLMVGFDQGPQQPCLDHDKSEISELDSHESDLKDIHLAEIDIVAACLRTDILQRLHYILEMVRPSYNSVQYSLQILTRFVRISTDTALKIVQTGHLMETVIQNFVPNTSINFNFEPNIVYKRKPILAALKFIRILSSQSQDIVNILVTKYDILNTMSSYISSSVDGTYGLRIQIEAFCIMSNCLYYNVGIENCMALCSIIITTLYKHVDGTDLNSNVTSVHAAVLIHLINRILKTRTESIQPYKQKFFQLIKDGMFKWLTQFANCDIYTHHHLRLVCSIIDCTKTILVFDSNVPIPVKEVINTLNMLYASRAVKKMQEQLMGCSNLLSKIGNHQLHSIKNIMTLQTTVIDVNHRLLPILSDSSPFMFFKSLFNLLYIIKYSNISNEFLKKISNYLEKIKNQSLCLCDNWFTRIETDFIFSVLKVATSENRLHEHDKDMIYAVGNKLCYILRQDKMDEVQFLFNNIIFNKDLFTADRHIQFLSLSDINTLSVNNIQCCYTNFIKFDKKNEESEIVVTKWQEPFLPRDWIYLPILNSYSKSQEFNTSRKAVGTFKEKINLEPDDMLLVIKSSLEWILFNEICFSDLLNDITLTDRFCRIMCIFLCEPSLFLLPTIKVLLCKCLQILFKKEKQSNFNFDQHLIGLHNFQDFYTQFLEQFQSVSYGDHNFVACVLVPLAQKHNVKWRKLIWSEYAGCLRALDCPEDMLCYDIKEYLYPEETDMSLIKSYFHALSSNLLRSCTIAFKIASHHVQCYKNRIKNNV